jgi:hypothetical protein
MITLHKALPPSFAELCDCQACKNNSRAAEAPPKMKVNPTWVLALGLVGWLIVWIGFFLKVGPSG